MAALTITTTAKQDAAVQYMTDQFNARMNPPTPVTPGQFARRAIDDLLNGWVARADNEQGQTKGQLYQKATPDDQATIDAILQKYAGT